MVLHIKITTKFDITHTKVTQKIVPILPISINGKLIKTVEEWNKCRRQQINWETFIQILSLRTQLLNIKTYKKEINWVLEFDVEFEKIFADDNDELQLLKTDCYLIPMLIGLEEEQGLDPIINYENTTFEFIKSD